MYVKDRQTDRHTDRHKSYSVYLGEA